ncbi:hypothetical protein Nepgr_000334 [Nepenthes gracilis]|uniref:Elongin-A n=1 Tax=Nepenthes gracilis TaxID=150966 RepID=A0AAD3P4B3_NEPGR|nr:hypothetical protein Nepgr_000334 [Nepenthes gracilis]
MRGGLSRAVSCWKDAGFFFLFFSKRRLVPCSSFLEAIDLEDSESPSTVSYAISLFDRLDIYIGEMRSRFIHISDRGKRVEGKVPALVDLCVQTAIDNVRYIGDVGETDTHLLERILPHCTVEQLMHVENMTEGRDLSPVTNKLWRKFYEAKFGVANVNLVVERMNRHNITYSWRQLYQAKLKVQDQVQKESVERLTQLYKKEDARKQSRQIKICTKVPPATKKRGFCGGFGAENKFSNAKSNLMKKAKVDYLNSRELQNRVAIKRSASQKSTSVGSSMKPLGMNSASTLKFRR